MADLNAIPGLKRRIAATWRRQAAVQIARAFGPFILFVGAFVILALAGVWDRVSAPAAAIATLLVFLGGGYLALRGRRALALPSDDEARRALDAQSDFRPIAALTDHPAKPGREGRILWSAHRERAAAAAETLRPPSFASTWRTIDPLYLRFAAPSAILALTLLAGSDALGRLNRALAPDYGSLLGAGGLQVEAWITPPDYTGAAPIFLSDGRDEVRAPAGSEITIRAQARSAPSLRLASDDGRRSQRFEASPDGAFEVKTVIVADTRLSVRWWGERAAWSISAAPDAPPIAAFTDPPKLGKNDRTEFGWSASDDFGISRLELVLTRSDPHPAAPDEIRRVPVPMRAVSAREAAEAAALDLTRHPWAGLDVEARLVATDAAGQEGVSEPVTFKLPEKLFLESLAKSVQEIRVTVLREPRTYKLIADLSDDDGLYDIAAANRLEAAPPDVQRAAFMLDAVSYQGEKFIQDRTIWLGLRSARAILGSAEGKAQAEAQAARRKRELERGQDHRRL
ncbi:MAG: DUF4175 family protein, partial [Pseudomonadota bacterium]